MNDYVLSEDKDYILSFFCYERDRYIELSMISIKKEHRNQGIASRIMKRLCQYADKVEKPILLTPDHPEGDREMSASALIRFYEKFDFQRNKGSIKDTSMASHSYKRMPQ